MKKSGKQKTEMNSRNKGKRGEREFASVLREHGFDARRGQQFSGGADSPDVVSDALNWLHIEVKRVQNLNLTDACIQAERDCGLGAPAGHKKPWVVAHRRNHAPWFITMRAETFFDLLRGVLPPEQAKRTNGTDEGGEQRTSNIQHPTANVEQPTWGEGSARTECTPIEMISAAMCVAANNEQNQNKNERS